MEETFFWIDDETLINMSAVAYLKFDQSQARIVLTSGDAVEVAAQRIDSFRKFLTKKFNKRAEETKGKSGFVTGPRLT